MMQRKFVLVGGYGHGNLGDDALMLTAVSALARRVPKCDITILVREPAGNFDYIHKLVPGCEVVASHNGDTIACDSVVFGGGTMFRAFAGAKKKLLGTLVKAAAVCATNPSRVVRRIARFRTRSRSYPTFTATRAFALGIGLGPFVDGGHNIREARDALRPCDYLSVRDRFSKSLCRTWGMPWAVQRADLCFCSDLWSGRRLNRAKRSDRVRCIGVVVRDWRHTETGASYMLQLQHVVTALREMNYTVRYVLFQNELLWRRILSRDEDEVSMYSPDKWTVSDFVGTLNQFDLIITTRAHGAILAAIMGIPSICVEIEPKLRYVWESLHGGSKLWSPPFAGMDLIASVEQISNNLRAYSGLTREAVKANCRRAELSVSEFLQVL
ncbi:MAG: polysaccharide pyruvyl transferase family protein [Phycisphaerales bacterium]|nr:MAG: polysaccharide pyruvyl transferase family protein [Phycisphaerales bacterium]